MDSVIMISDVAWIARGVAKKIPDKVKLDDEELKQLISGSVPDTSDVDTDQEKEEPGVRGSAADQGRNDVEMIAGKRVKKNDAEGSMRGIAMYASNVDDPYVTLHVDSDEEEREEIEVKSDDNMVVLAKIDKDNYILEVYVYNEANNDWYCHHDYIIDAPPLCLEPIQHDPGNEDTGKGNLLAVGTMEPVINIWDLDVMNAVAPVVTLGAESKCRRRKRDGRDQGHSDAVLSIAWNKITPHVFGSGDIDLFLFFIVDWHLGADRQIVLWDLDGAKAAQAITGRSGEMYILSSFVPVMQKVPALGRGANKVQALTWHPAEASFILSGTLTGTAEVLDCREASGAASAVWEFNSQIEQLTWNHFNPFTAVVGSDDGMLRHIDMRKPGAVLWEDRAHDGSIGGLTLSSSVRGLLVTVGSDQMMCVWKIQEDGLLLKVHSEAQHIGTLHAARFSPDVATICCIGGSSNDLVKVVDVGEAEAVMQAFS